MANIWHLALPNVTLIEIQPQVVACGSLNDFPMQFYVGNITLGIKISSMMAMTPVMPSSVPSNLPSSLPSMMR